VKFRPPTPLAFSYQENSPYLEIDLPSHLVSTLLLWDIKDIYGAFKGLYEYLGELVTIHY
jgi:hypothetical protein